MGNKTGKEGYHLPPPSYLKEIKKQTNQHLRDIEQQKQSSSSTSSKKEPEAVLADLSDKSVKKYILSHRPFLDKFVTDYVSQDRVRAWVQQCSERREDKKKHKDDPDFTAALMERALRQQQTSLVTRSCLVYPKLHDDDELTDLIKNPYSEKHQHDIETHQFPYTTVCVNDINKVFILMVNTLLTENSRFPGRELCNFLCTLQANYYNIDYHNYSHALSHAQSMYWILRRNSTVFNDIEMRCLLIGALAHDVGHPGVTESFLRTTGNGLDKLYHSPILENHHVQTLFLILQDFNCNVFCDLSGEDYKQVLDELKHAILSTNIRRYYGQIKHMQDILDDDISLDRKSARDASKSVLMMACDLCSCWKDWEEHTSIVQALYDEFFQQGEKEMKLQIDPDPYMRRENSAKIPEYQVNFFENTALPVVQITVDVFPNCKPLLEETKKNLKIWNTTNKENIFSYVEKEKRKK